MNIGNKLSEIFSLSLNENAIIKDIMVGNRRIKQA